MSFKNRLVFGVLVTEAMAKPSVFRSVLCGIPFVHTVFGDFEPQKLNTTITLEQEPAASHVSGSFEIVTSTTRLMKSGVLAAKKYVAENPVSPAKPGKKPKDPGVSFIQFSMGSREFCEQFLHFWAATAGVRSQAWAPQMLQALKKAKLHDVIWVDILDPATIHRDTGSEMMRRNISKMVA